VQMKAGTVLTGLLCATAFLAALVFMPVIAQKIDRPFLAGAAYLAFAPFCHQLPGRSFHISGVQLAVCARCAGIYFGLFIGALFFSFWKKPVSRLILWPAALLAADGLLNFLGIAATPSYLRLVFGLGFGFFGGWLLALGASDLEEMVRGRGERKWEIKSTI